MTLNYTIYSKSLMVNLDWLGEAPRGYLKKGVEERIRVMI